MTSINRIFKDELQEFEALLEDNDQQDGYFPKISNSAHIKITNDFMVETSPPNSYSAKIERRNEYQVPKTTVIKTEDEYRSSLFDTLGLLPDDDEIKLGKKSSTALSSMRAKTNNSKRNNIPNIIISKPKKSNKDLVASLKEEKLSEAVSTLRELNKDMQKSSYNELLTLYKDSTSQNPIKAFDESGNSTSLQRVDSVASSRESSLEAAQAKIRLSNRAMIFLNQNRNKEGNNIASDDQAMIKDARRTIEGSVRAVQTNPGTNFTHSAKCESQKIETINWREIFMKEHPMKVEVLIMDIVNFGVISKTEINMKSLFSQIEEITGKINRVVMEISDMKSNDAKHIMIFLHPRKGPRKLFLSKYFFTIKNNFPYSNGLQTEKEVIMYYMVILGIFHFRFKYEDKPISESKLNSVKLKALNMIKGIDNSSSPHLVEWFNEKVRADIFIEKFYLNQNNKGKTDVNFRFKLTEYLQATNSRFLPENQQKLLSTTSSNLSATLALKSTNSSFMSLPRRDAHTAKSLTVPPRSEGGESLILNSPTQRKSRFFNETIIRIDMATDYSKVSSRLISKSSQNTPKMNEMNPSSSLNSLAFLSPRDKLPTLTAPMTSYKTRKTPNLSTELEFVELNIAQPKSFSRRIETFMSNSSSRLTVGNWTVKK